MSAKPDMNIRDLAKLANIADLIGYTDFDGTHFTADGYEPVAMTAYTATMKRLHKADTDARTYVSRKLVEAGWTRKANRRGTGRYTYNIVTFTKDGVEWRSEWSKETCCTIWSRHSTVGHTNVMSSGEALQRIRANGA